MEFLCLVFVFNNNERFVIWSCLYFERPKFHIFLNYWVIEFSANKSLCIKDSVSWVFGSLIFGCISDKSFCVSEGNIWGSSSVSLVVGYDLDSFVLPDTYTGVGGSKINSNSFSLWFFWISHSFLIANSFVEVEFNSSKKVLECSIKHFRNNLTFQSY